MPAAGAQRDDGRVALDRAPPGEPVAAGFFLDADTYRYLFRGSDGDATGLATFKREARGWAWTTVTICQ